MARYKRANGVQQLAGPSPINPIERDVDNTSLLAKKELSVRSRKKKAASDQTVPGKVVTSPPTVEAPLGG